MKNCCKNESSPPAPIARLLNLLTKAMLVALLTVGIVLAAVKALTA